MMTLNCLLCRCFINGGLISGKGRAGGVIWLSVAVTPTYTQASFIIRPVSGVINRYIYLLYYWNHRPLIPLVLLSDFTYRNVQFESFFVNILSTSFIQLPFLACCWTDADKKWYKSISNGRVFLKTSKYSIINLLPKRNDFQTNIHVIVIVYISFVEISLIVRRFSSIR